LLGSDEEPYNPPEMLRPDEFWERAEAGGRKSLEFADAPKRVSVTYRTRWVFSDVPVGHQMGVVYFAAAKKCEALASWYRKTLDSASGFNATETADGYTSQAGRHRADALRVLGIGNRQTLTVARAGRAGLSYRVFRRWIP
jgi:hypothetical protein